MPVLKEPIFVVGMDRSGTTLLSAMLDAHPRIAMAPETWFIEPWAVQYANKPLDQPACFETFWSAYTAHPYFSHLGLDGEAIRHKLSAEAPATLAQIFATLLAAYAARFNKPRVGEKTPHHYRHVARLLEWFPDARVVWMLRDPRAVYHSFRQTPFGHEWTDIHAREWRTSVELMETLSRDPRVKVVKYEELVSRPFDVMQEICAFIGEAFDGAMISRTESGHRLEPHTGWMLQNEVKALSPVSTASLEAWKTGLPAYKVKVIEHYAARTMREHGYEPETNGLSCSEFVRMHLGRLRRNLRYHSGGLVRQPHSIQLNEPS